MINKIVCVTLVYPPGCRFHFVVLHRWRWLKRIPVPVTRIVFLRELRLNRQGRLARLGSRRLTSGETPARSRVAVWAAKPVLTWMTILAGAKITVLQGTMGIQIVAGVANAPVGSTARAKRRSPRGVRIRIRSPSPPCAPLSPRWTNRAPPTASTARPKSGGASRV